MSFKDIVCKRIWNGTSFIEVKRAVCSTGTEFYAIRRGHVYTKKGVKLESADIVTIPKDAYDAVLEMMASVKA